LFGNKEYHAAFLAHRFLEAQLGCSYLFGYLKGNTIFINLPSNMKTNGDLWTVNGGKNNALL